MRCSDMSPGGVFGLRWIGLLWFACSLEALQAEVIFHENWDPPQPGWDVSNGVWQFCKGAQTVCNGGKYPLNTGSYLVSPAITLPAASGDEEILLFFWNSYRYSDGRDKGQVEVYADGKWNALSSVTYDSPVSSVYKVDLTRFGGKTVYLGFHHASDAWDTYDGWNIGDLTVVKEVPVLTTDLDEWDGWGATGVWQIGPTTVPPPDPCFNGKCAGTVLGGNYPLNTDAWLISPSFRLSPVQSGQEIYLSFCHWFSYSDGRDYGSVYVYSLDETNGSWVRSGPLSTFTRDSTVWSRKQVRLTPYAGKKVRVGFVHVSDAWDTYRGWYIDTIQLLKPPVPPVDKLTVRVDILTAGALRGESSADSVAWEVPAYPKEADVPVHAAATLVSDIAGEFGVQGWSLSLEVGPCFRISDATTAGTAAAAVDDDPPGLRQGGFEATEIVDPDDSHNGGRHGVVSATVLAFKKKVNLAPQGEETILRFQGSLDGSGLDSLGSKTAPCLLRPLTDGEGLKGSGMPVATQFTVNNETMTSTGIGASVQLVANRTSARFVRGDVDGSGAINLTDAINILSLLFLDSSTPIECLDAADTTDAGALNVTSAIYLLNWLFLGGPAPPAPSPSSSTYVAPGECGPDPTEDALDCKSFFPCP